MTVALLMNGCGTEQERSRTPQSPRSPGAAAAAYVSAERANDWTQMYELMCHGAGPNPVTFTSWPRRNYEVSVRRVAPRGVNRWAVAVGIRVKGAARTSVELVHIRERAGAYRVCT